MSDKTITIPAGTQSVTLNIKREAEKPRMGCTLADALAMTPSNQPAIVRVRERNGLRWDVNLGPVTTKGLQAEDGGWRRNDRICTFSMCQMCDAQVLLERRVKATRVETNVPFGIALVYEVDVDGD